MEAAPRRFDVRDYLRIVTKRKWFIALVALAAMVVGGLYTISYAKTFRASALVIVRPQVRPTYWPGEAGMQALQRQEVGLDSLARIAGSSVCAQGAADKLSNPPTPRKPLKVSAQEIAASISVTPERPDLLHIDATNHDGPNAVEFANAVAEAFVDRSLKLQQVESTAAKEYLNGAMRGAEAELDAAQTELATCQQEIGVVVPEAEPAGDVEQLRGYQIKLDEARGALAAAVSSVAVLQDQLRRTPNSTAIKQEAPNPSRLALQEQLETASVSLNELRARYTDTWPAVQEMKDRVAQLQVEIARTPETITTTSVAADPDHAALQRTLVEARRLVADLQARVASLSGDVARLASTQRTMPEKLGRMQRLIDRVELAKASYKDLQEQLGSARLSEAMKQADAEVIGRAGVAEETSPRLKRMLLFSMMLGLAAGVLLALFMEALDDTLHSPEDVATYTEATFLGMVPLLEGQERGLNTVLAPKSPPAEAYRSLRSNIRFAQVDHPARTFMVTSAGAGEGKSLTTANLAVVFAQAGQKVLLVDTDLRRPSLHRVFNVSATRGLTNVLVGESNLADVIVETGVPGLRLVPTGPLPPNPAELLESAPMNRVIEQSKELADIVFFDTPPAIVLTDAVIMSAKVDRAILVAEAGKVTRDAFNEVCRLITNARGTILGVVLNKLRLSAGDSNYYYYYYDYSHPSLKQTEAEVPVYAPPATRTPPPPPEQPPTPPLP